MSYDEWELSVNLAIERDLAIVSCTNTVKPKNSSSWIRAFETIEINLNDLSSEMQRALGFPED
jgi:hypothetical protein